MVAASYPIGRLSRLLALYFGLGGCSAHEDLLRQPAAKRAPTEAMKTLYATRGYGRPELSRPRAGGSACSGHASRNLRHQCRLSDEDDVKLKVRNAGALPPKLVG